METEGLIAIVCVVIAIVILLSLTIFTAVKAWKQIGIEHAQGVRREGSAENAYDEAQFIPNDHATDADVLNGNKHREHAQTEPHQYETVNHKERADSEHAAVNEVVVHEYSNDTSF